MRSFDLPATTPREPKDIIDWINSMVKNDISGTGTDMVKNDINADIIKKRRKSKKQQIMKRGWKKKKNKSSRKKYKHSNKIVVK